MHADVADDLAQLALMRIAGAVSRIDPERAEAYIGTIARNLLRTAYRARARDHDREGDAEPSELPAPAMSPDQRAEYEDLMAAVHRACLTKLGPGLREVAVGLLNGASTAEIATELHISPITVRTRLLRMRGILRAELSPHLEAGSEPRRKPG